MGLCFLGAYITWNWFPSTTSAFLTKTIGKLTLYGDGLWVTSIGYCSRSVFPLRLFLGTVAYCPYLQERYVSADKAGASHVFRKPNVSNPKLHWECFIVLYLSAQTVPRTHLWRTVVAFWGFLPVKILRPWPLSRLSTFCCGDGSPLLPASLGFVGFLMSIQGVRKDLTFPLGSRQKPSFPAARDEKGVWGCEWGHLHLSICCS